MVLLGFLATTARAAAGPSSAAADAPALRAPPFYFIFAQWLDT
jgi:hypothetical protein